MNGKQKALKALCVLAVAIALCHARSYTSRLQSPDAARPGSGRYEVRNK